MDMGCMEMDGSDDNPRGGKGLCLILQHFRTLPP